MAYRRAARPSGSALSAARQAASRRVEDARAELEAARLDLDVAQRAAAELRRSHDEAVSIAEQERTRALRLAIALADPATVPPRLRESLGREQRERALSRALEGRGSPSVRSEPPRAVDPAEAVAALTAARTERARALSAQVALLGERERAVKRAAEALVDAEDDLRRLDA
jgi:hypothetical protein